MKLMVFVLTSVFGFCACSFGSASSGTSKPVPANTTQNAAGAAAAAPTPTPEPDSPANQPKTIRDFFALLPEKYFTLEGCDRDRDVGCKKARAEYLKTFTEVEDIANGYFKGGCDGAQSCIEMAIFKRPNGTYLVGVATSSRAITTRSATRAKSFTISSGKTGSS